MQNRDNSTPDIDYLNTELSDINEVLEEEKRGDEDEKKEWKLESPITQKEMGKPGLNI